MQRIADSATVTTANSTGAINAHRQTGISMIPTITFIFTVTLLTTQVFIPNQFRELRESNIEAAAKTAEHLVQAALAYRADPDNDNSWPGHIGSLAPKYLPIFTNRTPWDGSWIILTDRVEETEETGKSEESDYKRKTYGIKIQTDTGDYQTAMALAQKIGDTATVNGSIVEIAVVTPVEHYVQSLSVGWLKVGNIEELTHIPTNNITIPYEEIPSQTETHIADNLLVNNNLDVKNNAVINGTLTVNRIIEKDLGGSSKRFKQNIKPLEIDANSIYQLQPVSYDYKDQYKHYQTAMAGGRELGLIAEQVNTVIPELAIRQDEQIVNVDYQKLSVVMLQAMQQLKAELDSLQVQNQRLQAQLDRLQNSATQ
jgi:hypothetical protein